jgi:prevent-host-death family protein
MDREVGSYEAKTRLPELLRYVAQGERVTITRHGRAVAEISPPRRRAVLAADRADKAASDGVATMLAFEPIRGVEAQAVADWITEGRR